MKKQLLVLLAIVLLAGCGGAEPGEQVLSPTDFRDHIAAADNAVILDVRSPGEFAQGHLEGAQNVDWNGNDFVARLSKMDKSATYFVYCLSGGRSAEAASHMRAEGFQVYELDGGMLGWRGAHLPETAGGETIHAGMTRKEFDKIVTSDKTVLVDFYADWCGPCKQMEPSLDELSREQSATLKIVRINVDESPELAAEMGVTALPTLHTYQSGKRTWTHVGYLTKDQLTAAVKK